MYAVNTGALYNCAVRVKLPLNAFKMYVYDPLLCTFEKNVAAVYESLWLYAHQEFIVILLVC